MNFPLRVAVRRAAGSALALVHGLHPSDRDGVPFLDELCTQPLRARHVKGPGITVAKESERRVDREV